MTKQILTVLIASALLLPLFAEEQVAVTAVPVNYGKWTTVEGDLQKDVRKYAQFDEKGLRLTSTEKPFGYFCTEPIPCKVQDKIKIRLEASGSGVLKIGFLEYKSGYSYTGTLVKEIRLAKRSVPYEFEYTVDAAQTTLVRPVIFVSADAAAVISDLSIEK